MSAWTHFLTAGVALASLLTIASMQATATTATAPAISSSTVFPPKVSAKYAGETAGKARMHTCLDQYKANKAAHANGGLSWIQKGGGYYSACSKHLRG